MNTNIYDIDYSITRYYVDEFYFSRVQELKAGSSILDLGGHKSHKRGRFDIEKYPLRVIYANLVADKKPDIQCDGAQLPTSSEAFDVVICSEILEHVSEPSLVLQEVYRVLKPDGCLLATVPFLFRVHGDPYDYNRFTDYYWRSLLKKTGFFDISIEKQGSFYTVMVDFLKQYATQYAAEKMVFPWVVRQLSPVMQRWAFRRENNLKDERWPEFIQSYTIGYGICAKKL